VLETINILVIHWMEENTWEW